MVAPVPARGTREYQWWMAGAEAEAAARKEGRSTAGLEVRDAVDALAEHYPQMSQADIAAWLSHVYGASTAPLTSPEGVQMSSTSTARALVELKVIASTAAAGLAGVGVTVLNQAVADDALLGPVPVWGQTLITMLVPPVVAFLAGWSARHTPRPDLTADPAPAAVESAPPAAPGA
jgi:hypothetical protein